MSLIEMTLSGGVLILFITVVRALALHRLPKGVFLVLWEVAALRLLLPYTIPLPFGLLPQGTHLPVGVDSLWGTAKPAPALPTVGMPSAGPAAASPAPGPSPLTILWLVGAIALGVYFALLYVRAHRRFRSSLPERDPAVLEWVASQKLLRALEVRRSPLVDSPLTYGIFYPVVLLPADMKTNDTAALTCILTHELVHIRRFDGLAKLVFAAALCVHWFNPLVWVMYVLANRDLELSCDARVMDTLGLKEKVRYALTLIGMEESRSLGFSPCNHFSKLAIEERINAIMKYRKTSIPAVMLAGALVLCATTAFAASAQTTAPGHTDTAVDDCTILSYVDPEDGKTYYSWDKGETYVPLTEEEFKERFPGFTTQWWTYEEFAAWLEKEKVELQSMLGEKGWTGGRGEFVWTQELIDETIARYETILQEIKEGKLYSKPMGDGDLLISSDGGVYTATDQQVVISPRFSVDKEGNLTPDPDELLNGLGEALPIPEARFDGSGDLTFRLTSKEEGGLDTEAPFLPPTRTEEEWRQIIADIESGKIPPFEMPDDPNVTVGFLDYTGGTCANQD